MSPVPATTLPFYQTKKDDSAAPFLDTNSLPGVCLPQRWTKSERTLEYCKAALIFTPNHLLLVAGLEQSHFDSLSSYSNTSNHRRIVTEESTGKDSAAENSAGQDSGTVNAELSWSPGRWVSGLWRETVVEAFLYNPEHDQYLELHSAPYHQWWLAKFSDLRKRHPASFAQVPALTWYKQQTSYQEFAVQVPLRALPAQFQNPALLRANLCAIETSKIYPDVSIDGAELLGTYPIEHTEYFSFATPQTPTPDFHRRELFLPLEPIQ